MYDGHFRFLAGLIRAYATASSADSSEPVATWELGARLEVACELHAAIAAFDQRIAQDVLAGRAPDDRAVALQVRDLYADWERHAARWVARLRAAEAAGDNVACAERFKAAVLDARSVLSLTLDQLDESARQLKHGQKRSMAEVVDGLRRRLGA